MTPTERYANWFKKYLPSPFTIAILLTFITFVGALINNQFKLTPLLVDWQAGLWDASLLTFAFQMMMMLVLGHVLALSTVFDNLIKSLVNPIKNPWQAAFIITLCTIIVAYFNWGLGLIFGAILTRKVGEHLSRKNIAFNYGLLGACGYVGLMVWHGGISGSSLTKVSEQGHLASLTGKTKLPDAIYYSDTVFSAMNWFVFALLLIVLPLLMYVISKKAKNQIEELTSASFKEDQIKTEGAERLDHNKWFSKVLGAILVSVACYIAITDKGAFLSFISPNYINFVLLGLCFLLHKSFHSFLSATDEAIKGAAGILIQFPLYFGILALMKSSGLIALTSEFFISVSNEYTYPLLTFFSAGLVNIFVPSGGGQWAIQGPIIVEAASTLGIPLNKCIMALAYGDQWTNMLQPFWALPLLSITGLKAKQILPYTLLLFLAGGFIFILGLILF